MDWIQVFTIIGILGGLTFWIDMRLREDIKQAKEDMKIIDEHHREDTKENNQHWRDMFMHFNNRLDNNRRD